MIDNIHPFRFHLRHYLIHYNIPAIGVTDSDNRKYRRIKFTERELLYIFCVCITKDRRPRYRNTIKERKWPPQWNGWSPKPDNTIPQRAEYSTIVYNS